jgi:hypothetical protein
MWVLQGVQIHVVMAWAGHSNIKTSMNIYTRVNPQDASIEAMIERLCGGADEASNVADLPAQTRHDKYLSNLLDSY